MSNCPLLLIAVQSFVALCALITLVGFVVLARGARR